MNVRHEAKRALGRRNRVAVAVCSCTLVTLVAAVSGAQDSGTSDWDTRGVAERRLHGHAVYTIGGIFR